MFLNNFYSASLFIDIVFVFLPCSKFQVSTIVYRNTWLRNTINEMLLTLLILLMKMAKNQAEHLRIG